MSWLQALPQDPRWRLSIRQLLLLRQRPVQGVVHRYIATLRLRVPLLLEICRWLVLRQQLLRQRPVSEALQRRTPAQELQAYPPQGGPWWLGMQHLLLCRQCIGWGVF